MAAHDHEQSERDRQAYEHQQTARELVVERQVGLVLEGALSRIESKGSAIGAQQLARDALAAAQRLRERR